MKKITSVIIQIVIFAIAIFLSFFFSYLVGYDYLLGDSLPGNDSFSFFVVTDWLSKFFPKVPFWFPIAGGGISFAGYQWLSAYFVNVISYLSSLNLVQSFRFLGFASIPLTGIGVFVFCWARLTEVKSVILRQVIGLIASVFLVSAPASWIFLTRWGFYAESISMIFIPWIILFLDLVLEKLFEGKFDKYYRLGILGLVIFGVIGFSTHFYVVMTTLLIATTLFLTKFLSQGENKIVLFKRIFLPTLFLGLIIAGAFIFRYYSYSSYTKAVAYGGLRGASDIASDREGTKESLLTPMMMLSLSDVSSEKLLKPRDLIVDMRFPFYVWILLIPSLVFGFFRSKKIFVFAVLAIIGFIVNTNIDAYILFSKIPILGTAFLGRLFFVTGRIIIPITASFGAFVIWDVLLTKLRHKSFLVMILGILTVSALVFKFYNLPYAKEFINIGASNGNEHVYIKDIWRFSQRPNAIMTTGYKAEIKDDKVSGDIVDLKYLKYICAFDGPSIPTSRTYDNGHMCSYYPNPQAEGSDFPIDRLKAEQERCNSLSQAEYVNYNNHCLAFFRPTIADQLKFGAWKKVQLSGSIDGELSSARNFFNGINKSGEYRYDVSGFSARTLMSLPLVSDNSMIQVYINNLSLIYNLWNYQSSMMYSNFPLYQKPGVLTEIAKWYGISYVYLAGTPLEPLEYWKLDPNWIKITGQDNDGWRQFQGNAELTTWDTRPKMLVIADDEKNFYDETFKFLTRGGLKYEQAIPVQGGKFVDAYSEDELAGYEMLFMRAYDYKNKSRAYKLLDNYVKNGGKLIFDTGWQYYIPDFQIENAPEFMPFEGLTWKNLDRNTVFDVPSLGDLTYGDSSWGVSAPTKLRSWAQVKLSAGGTPLAVSGSYGKGKVLWFGFNIIPHSETKDSINEVNLFNTLVTDIIGDNNNQAYQFEKSRPNPDRVEFKLQESVNSPSNLFFREGYYPDWHAKLVSGGKSTDLKINRAGPGFMLINLPTVKSGDRVILEIKKPFGQYIANAVSILTFAGLLVYLFAPQVFPRVKLPTPKAKPQKNEDEEY